MREMLLAATVCAALGLALSSLRTTGRETLPDGLPREQAETTAILSMAGAPVMIGDGNGEAGPGERRGGSGGGPR